MDEEQLFDGVIRDGTRDLAAVVCWLTLSPSDWCIIGGMAVNGYTPTALYDDHLDVAIEQEPGFPLLSDLAAEGFRVDLDPRARVARLVRPGDGHRLKIVIHYGPAYCSMPARASRRAILGRCLPVASLPDLSMGLLLTRDDEGQGWHARGKAELDLVRLQERDRELADVDGWGEQAAA